MDVKLMVGYSAMSEARAQRSKEGYGVRHTMAR
jgi:hypothetical protein